MSIALAIARPAPATPILRVRVQGKPVSVNSAYGRRKGFHGLRLTPGAATWRNEVWAEVYRQKHILRWQPDRLPLAITITYFNLNPRADVDNFAKLTLDGLALALSVDDRHFTPVTAHKVRNPAEKRGALIEVAPASRLAGVTGQPYGASKRDVQRWADGRFAGRAASQTAQEDVG